MKKYKIINCGCDDKTEGSFEFTQEQFEFLNNVFTELNKNSNYCCMPEIYIEEIMTDKDIIEALERCVLSDYDSCTFKSDKSDERNCASILAQHALDLISRLQLKNKILSKYDEQIKVEIKSEEAKELSEWLKGKAYPFPLGTYTDSVENVMKIKKEDV